MHLKSDLKSKGLAKQGTMVAETVSWIMLLRIAKMEMDLNLKKKKTAAIFSSFDIVFKNHQKNYCGLLSLITFI